ncbi:unnamed protein product [Polarella glacialis]|uniref:Uncharacterized protein n=1 Tax=Polarella glacialis TaxID=89957 RepID=A0A813FRY6_POLGL|nr:unnamed protein product [Polarella glacialis]
MEVALSRRRGGRQESSPAPWPERPIARLLAVWMAFSVGGSRMRPLESSGDIFFTESAGSNHLTSGASKLLLPIFVEHDRAAHAERQALLHVTNMILAGQNEMEDGRRSDVRGEVRLLGVHTPCISCLAVFCQFKAIFPNVDLQISFDDWPATRQSLLQAEARHSRKKRSIVPVDILLQFSSNFDRATTPEDLLNYLLTMCFS